MPVSIPVPYPYWYPSTVISSTHHSFYIHFLHFTTTYTKNNNNSSMVKVTVGIGDCILVPTAGISVNKIYTYLIAL